MQKEKITIFDTTLRDGEQAPGAALNLREKVAIAKSLERLGVDVIEAGFPISSKVDFDAVYQIGAATKNCVVAALSRAKADDVESAIDALKKARRGRVHIFLATSDLHLKYKLKISREQAKDMISRAIKRARNFVEEVQFSFEDACRTDYDFLREATQAAIKAGASIINAPDTVGALLPSETTAMIKAVVEAAEGRAIVSTHAHDDLGLAVANSLAAIEAGARQIECTINGIGERAGNAALEEIAVILATRLSDRYETRIDTRLISAISDEASRYCAMPKAPNKAIVGANAFSHGSGVHQDGIMKEASTYEIFSPELVGARRAKIVLTRHSGSAAAIAAAREAGFIVQEDESRRFFAAYKRAAERCKIVSTEAIVQVAQSLGLRAYNLMQK
ncbi:MAG: 2-isopropylmalate synthase [Helicobacteraceae bacterium]|jgi:2-isopropylmalate synthase|nr:2-isopropylmalate synthase [Helicobacteraceae bacterium]